MSLLYILAHNTLTVYQDVAVTLTCESDLLAADGTSILFLFVLAGVFVVSVRVGGPRASAAGARSTLLFEFL